LRDHFAMWEVFIGLLFIAVVRFLPHGLAGLASAQASRDAPAGSVAVPAPPSAALKPVPTLIFDEVRSSQGGVRILDGLSFRLEGPGIRAVIGPNGAGKTSMFNVLTGRLPTTGGRMHLGGRDVTGQATWRVARLGVGRKMQVPSVFAELTVRENLSVALWAGRLQGTAALRKEPHSWHTPLLDELLGCFTELGTSLHLPAGQLSQGHRQALEFVMTVLPEPHLLLLDEPCAGLSPAETHRMIQVIRRAVERLQAGALLIEHDLAAVAALEGEVYVLHQGRMLAKGTLQDMQADPAVRAVYAGGRK
jgi:branched-chain amino acid transport system permease protein